VEFPGFCRHALGALRNGDASAIAAWGCSWADNENCSQHLMLSMLKHILNETRIIEWEIRDGQTIIPILPARMGVSAHVDF